MQVYMWYNPAVYCTEGALAMFIRRRTIFGEVIPPTTQTRVECLAHEASHFFYPPQHSVPDKRPTLPKPYTKARL